MVFILNLQLLISLKKMIEEKKKGSPKYSNYLPLILINLKLPKTIFPVYLVGYLFNYFSTIFPQQYFKLNPNTTLLRSF